jgi:MarR family transcriptional regulator, organic hydroperoxide resistance regulator
MWMVYRMTDNVKNDYLWETGNLFRKIWNEYEDYLMPENVQVSPHQMYFLKFLDLKGMLTPSEIAEQLGITLGAVTGFMDRVYKLGMISRTRSEEDRRVVLIELTEEGKKHLQVFDRQREKKHAEILNRYGTQELLQLNKSLEKFSQVLDDLRKKE